MAIGEIIFSLATLLFLLYADKDIRCLAPKSCAQYLASINLGLRWVFVNYSDRHTPLALPHFWRAYKSKALSVDCGCPIYRRHFTILRIPSRPLLIQRLTTPLCLVRAQTSNDQHSRTPDSSRVPCTRSFNCLLYMFLCK